MGRRLRGAVFPCGGMSLPQPGWHRTPEQPPVPLSRALSLRSGAGSPPSPRIPASLGTSGKNKPCEAPGPGRSPNCIRRTQVQRAPTLGRCVGVAAELMNERAAGRERAPPRARGWGWGWGAGSLPCCYSDHSGSDSQTWIMNISEDFDVRVEIYQQIQWGRNIKCKSVPALCQRY